jgi:hypothetical protein
MTTKDTIKHINEGYTTKGEYYLGGAILEGRRRYM